MSPDRALDALVDPRIHALRVSESDGQQSRGVSWPLAYNEGMQSTQLTIDTARRRLVDLNEAVAAFCAPLGDGLVNVFAPHATVGLALIEVGAGSEPDLEAALERLLPRDERYVHHHGSPGHGADHLLPALLSPSVTIPVLDGRPALGIWQHVVLVDLNRDNPTRQVRLSFVGG